MAATPRRRWTPPRPRSADPPVGRPLRPNLRHPDTSGAVADPCDPRGLRVIGAYRVYGAAAAFGCGARQRGGTPYQSFSEGSYWPMDRSGRETPGSGDGGDDDALVGVDG